MATLILTAVGTAIGGPIGGAIGALIGQQADAVLFAPKKRQGPRLGDLAVQTSSYGTPIPRIFGTMRVAGTVVWATDLKETRSSSGGGKGKPKTVSYSYSASFAVALSGRPIQSVRRIWADGKLLRGVAGDFKSETGFRLHTGGEGQSVDPLIASAEGIGQATAFRGIAYAMFEDFQLGDYGNRIPSLSFELVADEGEVALGVIAEDLSEGAVEAGATPSVGGYAGGGGSVRGALEVLADVMPVSLVDGAAGLQMTVARGVVVPLDLQERSARSGESGGREEIARKAVQHVPCEVTVAYYDRARDYQTGMQRAVRQGAGASAEQVALPMTLDAGAAKAAAEYRLESFRAGRARAKLHVGPRRQGLRPGTLLRLPEQPGVWKVERWTLEHMVVTLELTGIPFRQGALTGSGDPGRPVEQADVVAGPTSVHLLDFPLADEQMPDRPRLLVAAAGISSGWRRAALTLSYDGGASWTSAGETAGAAVMGVARTVLAPGGAALFDRRAGVEIELLNDTMWIESRSDAALIAGDNLALLGDELIQFGSVEPLGGGRFRLERLLRGRRGTEWAAGRHAVGERFVLIAAESLAGIAPPSAMLGGTVRLLASGNGDGGDPAMAEAALTGESVRPAAPVHLAADRLANGDIFIRWVRRSRSGWAWLDGVDAPLGEENEAYRLTLSGAGFARSETVATPHYLYSVEAQAADGTSGPLTISVCQLGTVVMSRSAILVFSGE